MVAPKRRDPEFIPPGNFYLSYMHSGVGLGKIFQGAVHRRVARIWKRGGLFWKTEKCANDLDPEFSLVLNQFHTICPKTETKFLGKLENSKVFSAQKQVLSKKKVFTELETDFSARIGNPNVWGGAVFLCGGAIFNFSQKIGLKTTTKVRFCILHKPMGGLEPPLPPFGLRYWLCMSQNLKLAS